MADCWADIAKKYKIDEELINFTEVKYKTEICMNFHKVYPKGTLEEARAKTVKLCDAAPSLPFDGTVQPMTVPGTDTNPPVPVYVYKPNNLPTDPVILVYYHGGGLVLGSAKANTIVAKRLAQNCSLIVVDVDYRLLPNSEDPMAPFNDAATAAQWVMANKSVVGGTAVSKVGVGGVSAGGQITCCVTHDVSGIDFQILIYPVASVDLTVPSMKEFLTVPIFCGRDMDEMFKLCMPKDGAENPRFNPSANPDVGKSPPTLILSAELDPLIDWATSYEEKLKQAGVKVQQFFYPGLPHGFFAHPLMFPKAFAKANAEISTFLKSI